MRKFERCLTVWAGICILVGMPVEVPVLLSLVGMVYRSNRSIAAKSEANVSA